MRRFRLCKIHCFMLFAFEHFCFSEPLVGLYAYSWYAQIGIGALFINFVNWPTELDTVIRWRSIICWKWISFFSFFDFPRCIANFYRFPWCHTNFGHWRNRWTTTQSWRISHSSARTLATLSIFASILSYTFFCGLWWVLACANYRTFSRIAITVYRCFSSSHMSLAFR